MNTTIRLSLLLASFLLGSMLCAQNLALSATARTWDPNSRGHVPESLVNDGDNLTFWGSNEPTLAPPKDLGLVWPKPIRCSSAVIRFYSLGYVPAADGFQLQALANDAWQDLKVQPSGQESEWWTFRFRPVETTALRLLVTKFANARPAITEFEVYAGDPPKPALRRQPLLDGAFWALQYEGWATHYPTDERLAAEVDSAAAAGLKLAMLYTCTGNDGVFSTCVPGLDLPQSPWWQGRDPIEAILTRADALGVKVYLTDVPPTGFNSPVPADKAPLTAKLNAARKRMLDRYAKHPSLAGYYLNFECCPWEFGNDPAAPAAQAQKVAAFIKSQYPRLQIVAPIPLYQWRDAEDKPWAAIRPEQIERFFGPYMKTCQAVDAFMVIDGVGTGLSTLSHTDAAQACVRRLCEGLGRRMWSDVEVAVMGAKYQPMPIGRLIPSLEVAATHAETVVGFCYINYMSPGNGRPLSKRLYDDYLQYRQPLLGAGD